MIEARGSLLRVVRERLRSGRFPWLVGQGLRGAAIAAADRLRLPPITGPLLGTLVVTYRCTYSCPMCSVAGGSGEGELDTSAIESLVDQFADLGTPGLAITGGEPLLRDDVFQIIRRAKARGMIVNLSTNGHLLTEGDLVERLLGDPPDNVNISLDGSSASRHDRLRGHPGSFDRVVDGIRRLAERRDATGTPMHITVVSVLTEKSFGEANAFCDLVGQLGADAVGFIPHHSFSGKKTKIAANHWKEIKGGVAALLARKRDDAQPAIDNSRRYLEMLPLAMAGEETPVRCSSGYTTCFVDAYGDVYGCWPDVELHRPVGNTDGSTLREIWGSAEYSNRRREMRNCRACFWNCQTELNLLFRPFQRIGSFKAPKTSCGARGGAS